MKKTLLFGLLVLLTFSLTRCSQRSSTFYEPYAGKGDREYSAEGVASWYGRPFHGRRTASGQRYDMNQLTAAHRTLPFGAYVRVTNLSNDETVVVMINDRGPFAKNRLIDLSREAARRLDFEADGTTRVRLEWIDDPKNHPHPPASDSSAVAQNPPDPVEVPLTDKTAGAPSEGDLIAQEIDKELEQAE